MNVEQNTRRELLKIICTFVLLLSIALFAPNHSYAAGDWTGNADIVFGMKYFPSDWTCEVNTEYIDGNSTSFGLDLSKQLEIGFNIDFGKKTWPVNIAVAFLNSSVEDTYSENRSYTFKLNGSTQELRAGVKKIWEPSTIRVRPYLGGGLAAINAKMKNSFGDYDEPMAVNDSFNEHDSSIGFWINGGAYWTIASHYHLGIELVYSKASVKLLDTDIEAGGIHAGLCMGYQW